MFCKEFRTISKTVMAKAGARPPPLAPPLAGATDWIGLDWIELFIKNAGFPTMHQYCLFERSMDTGRFVTTENTKGYKERRQQTSNRKNFITNVSPFRLRQCKMNN